MQFEPKSEEQLQTENLLEAGEADFEVTFSSDEVSKSGNEMIKLELKVYGRGDETKKVFDYLMGSGGMEFKLRHFCEATGLMARYESGNLRAIDCAGKSGRADIDIRPAREGYKASNIIKDYLFDKDARDVRVSAVDSAKVPIDEDDIPF